MFAIFENENENEKSKNTKRKAKYPDLTFPKQEMRASWVGQVYVADEVKRHVAMRQPTGSVDKV